MIILALDTTTRGGSVAVADDDRILALIRGDESRTHAERLPLEIARALEMAKVTRPQIDLLAVATGPGAFTGLRIGLATIQGLAMALNTPVAGVSALDALAEQVLGDMNSESESREVDLILPWMDAQRGDVFSAIFATTRLTVGARHQVSPVEAPTTANPAALVDAWRAHFENKRVLFIGDAVTRDADVITRDGWRSRVPEPLAPQIAQLGRRAFERGQAGAPHALEPIYVRKPDAIIERDRRNS